MKTAYYFGTFNPIHFGHIAIAEAAQAQYGYTSIVFVPTFHPVHKKSQTMWPFVLRAKCLESVSSKQPGWEVSLIEAERNTPSYTVDTLMALITDFTEPKQAKVPLLIGSDALSTLGCWKNPELLADRCLFIVAPRKGYPIVTPTTKEGYPLDVEIKPLTMAPIDISSTVIRERFEQGLSLKEWVPECVERGLRVHME
jgi:nicotinate-nucleotide adenylyltransferase